MADITTAPTQPTTAATLGASPVIQALQEPRLIISKIVCKNFKSYAGVKELGPFHKVGGVKLNLVMFYIPYEIDA